jgi:tetratricopeptide (TPR) repeat protein
MGVGAGELLELSTQERRNDKYGFSYILALVAAHGLEREEKAKAYSNAGLASQYAGNIQTAEEYYKKAIEADPKYAEAYSDYASLLDELGRKNGTYGDILADEDYLDEAIKKYHEAIKNSDSMENPEKAEIHNNLGWVYAHLEKYNRATKEFNEAHKLDPLNVKVIRNIRALRKVKSEPKISNIQWCIAIVLFSSLIATWYLFWPEKLTENVFVALFIFLIAMIIFILFYHQLGKFKAGPIEFEKSNEHRSQPSEAIAKIER